VSVAAASALVFIILIYAIPDCKPIRGLNATAADNRSGLHNVNATTITTTTSSSSSSSSLAVGNSTDDDVTTVMTGVDNYLHVHGRDLYGYHDGHYVIQVGNTASYRYVDRRITVLLASDKTRD